MIILTNFSLFLEMVSLALKLWQLPILLKGQHLTEHNFVGNGFELHSSCLFKNGCSNDLTFFFNNSLVLGLPHFSLQYCLSDGNTCHVGHPLSGFNYAFFQNKVLHDVWLLVRVTQAQGLRTDTDPGGYKDLFAFS